MFIGIGGFIDNGVLCDGLSGGEMIIVVLLFIIMVFVVFFGY